MRHTYIKLDSIFSFSVFFFSDNVFYTTLETEKTEIKFHVFKFIDNVDHNKDHRIIFTKDMEEIYNCIPFDDFFYIKCFKINPSSLHPNGCEVNWSGNQLEITTNKTFQMSTNFYSKVNELKETSLHQAVSEGNLEAVKFLMECDDIDKEPKNIHGETPFHYAAEKGNIDIVKFLSSQAINIELRDYRNKTPLMKALEKGHLEIVKHLALQNVVTSSTITDEKKCHPIKKIVYAKIQKTGGSTLQNIFIRYGLKNDLKFALPKEETHSIQIHLDIQVEWPHIFGVMSLRN